MVAGWNWTWSSTSPKALAASSMKGEWNAPLTFRGRARPPASFTAAEKAGIWLLRPETEICPGQLKFTGYTWSKFAHRAVTCSGVSFTTAAMAVSCCSAAACISSPRRQTSWKPVCRSNSPATVAATTSPREKPATASGRIPASSRMSAAASSVANRQGWVFLVSRSSSSLP